MLERVYYWLYIILMVILILLLISLFALSYIGDSTPRSYGRDIDIKLEGSKDSTVHMKLRLVYMNESTSSYDSGFVDRIYGDIMDFVGGRSIQWGHVLVDLGERIFNDYGTDGLYIRVVTENSLTGWRDSVVFSKGSVLPM